MSTSWLLIGCMLFSAAAKSNQEMSSAFETNESSSNIWFVSDYGSDQNDCRTEFAPCQNLQVVLNRATDGADIYVTSDTLALDLVHGYVHGNENCMVNSSLSYNISSYNGTAILVTCSEGLIHWVLSDNNNRTNNTEENLAQNTEQNLAHLHIKHCVFDNSNVTFDLYGIVTFDNCSVSNYNIHAYFEVSLYRSQYEESPSPDDVANVFLYAKQNSVRFIRTKFVGKKYIFVLDSVRGVHISQSLIERDLLVGIGNEALDQHAVSYINIEDSSVANAEVFTETKTQQSIGYLSLRNTVFENTIVSSLPESCVSGAIVVEVENCTFSLSIVDFDDSIFWLENLVLLSIRQSRFNIDEATCPTGCALYVGKPTNQISLKLFYYFRLYEPTVMVSDTVFDGSSAVSRGGVIHCKDMSLLISNSVFRMTAKSKPPPDGGFIYYDTEKLLEKRGRTFELDHVTFDASQFTQAQKVSLVTLLASSGYITNITSVTALCPTSTKAVENFLGKYNIYLSCETACPQEYSLEAGNLTLDTNTNNWSVPHDPQCHSCPVGANCDSHIKGLPNYWGHVTQDNDVTMFRCPPDYCCQGNETCEGIDSCNTGRTGTLCGSCQKNMTESLFSPKCVNVTQCHGGLIATGYGLCVMAYAIVLFVAEPLKNMVLGLLKKLSKFLKKKCCTKCCAKEQSQSPNQRELESNESPSDKMKYIQILLYYVQDAALFRVHLPESGAQSESPIVQILQFSPEVLTSIYTNLTELCFKYGLTPVTKVVFKSLFGPFVMFFLFLFYLIQKLISIFVFKHSEFWKSLKACLVQAFLLALLFSFQKLVIGAFTLVQCVDLGDKKVLYIEGDIECGATWWQILFEFYIYVSILPLFFILSHTPFLVQDNTMSVRLFILACVFPLPVMAYLVGRLLKGRRAGNISINRKDEISMKGVSPDELETKDLMTKRAKEFQRLESEKEDVTIEQGPEDTVTSSSNYESKRQDTFGKECETTTSEAEGEATKSEAVILHTLLEHYRPLKVYKYKMQFTWFGVYHLYRVILMASNTYITQHLKRLWVMSVALIIITITNNLLKPYKDNTVNKIAMLSYAANICIAMINLCKSVLEVFGCETNCSLKTTLLWHLDFWESALLVYLPVGAFAFWLLYTGFKKVCGKSKTE